MEAKQAQEAKGQMMTLMQEGTSWREAASTAERKSSDTEASSKSGGRYCTCTYQCNTEAENISNNLEAGWAHGR